MRLDLRGFSSGSRTLRIRARTWVWAGALLLLAGPARATSYPLSPTHDAWIKQSSPGENHGADAFLAAKAAALDSLRSMLAFDLTAIPTGSTVLSATLKLHVVAEDAAAPLLAYRVTKSWNENSVTWSNRAGDWDPGAIHASFGVAAQDDSVFADLTSLVQQWVDGTHLNHGIVMMSSSTGIESRVASKEAAAGLRPRLTVVIDDAASDLSLDKAVDLPAPDETDAVTFTLTLANAGPDTATAAQVMDLLPAGLTYQSHSASQGSYVPGTGVWTVGALGNGANATLTIAATLDAGTAGTTIVNAASITASAPADPNSGNDADDASITVLAADLGLLKSVDDDTPDEGQLVSYTVTLGNAGPDAASGVQVTDLLPAGLTYQSHSASQGSYVPGTGVWTVGAVANGGNATLTLSATVDAGAAGTTIVNKAAITASSPVDPAAGNDADGASLTVQAADLAVSKSVNDPTPDEGQVVTFTVNLTNAGPHAAVGVQVTDLLPGGLMYQSHSASQGSYVSGTGIWTVGTVANGGNASLTLSATVNAGTAGTTIANTAAITAAATADPAGANDSDDATLTVRSADLALDKAIDDPTPDVGQLVTYTLTLSSAGPDGATGVQVTDLLPAGLTYQSHSASQGSYVPGTGVWTVGAVANGGNATLTLSATVEAGAAGATIANNATITAASPVDPNPANDADGASLTVRSANLGVAKIVNDTTPDEGQLVTYTVTLTSAGPDDASGIQVMDLLPAGLTYQSHSASQGTYVPGTGLWSAGALASGGSANLTLNATVNAGTAGTTIGNTATITASATGDPVAGNDAASVDVTVRSADLTLGNTVDDATPDVGELISYTVTIGNLGPSSTSGVQVTDLLPAGLTYQSHSATQGTFVPGTGIWTVGSLGSGVTQTLTLNATVNAGTAGQTIGNTAAVTASATGDPVAANDTATVNVTVRAANLALVKSVDNPTPDVGVQVTYTVTITNLGPNSTGSVQVTDLVPAGLIYQSNSTTRGSYASGSGIWSVGTLSSGASGTLTLRATVNSGSVGTTIVNTATIIASSTGDPVAANDTASASLTVKSSDLVVTKSSDRDSVDSGDLVTFTVGVLNQGPDATTNVRVTDLLPAGLAYQSHSATQGSYVSGTGVWTVGALGNGGGATLTLRATASGGAIGTDLTNSAAITGSSVADPVSGNNSDAVLVHVRGASLSLAKTVSDASPDEGDTLTYTITLANAGPDAASGVQVTDLLPAGLLYLSHAASQGTYVSGSGVWSAGTVASGGLATLALAAVVDTGTAGETITNSTAITSAYPADPSTADNSAAVGVTVRSAALTLWKAVDTTSPNEGDLVTFTLTITNWGPNGATQIEVTDQLPAGLTYQSHTASRGTFVPATGIWAVGSLSDGSWGSLTLRATVNAGTAGDTIVNFTQITNSFPPDPVLTQNQDDVTLIVQSADLSVSKTVGSPTANEGDLVTFTISLANQGPNSTPGVQITDLLPAGLTYQSYTASRGTYSSATGVWNVGSLNNGSSGTLTLRGRPATGTAGHILTNVAGVSASAIGDADPADNRDTAYVRVLAADLGLAMAVDDPAPDEGELLIYTLTVDNPGPDPASGVQVVDLLPPGLGFQSYTSSQGTYASASGVWTVGALGVGGSASLTLRAIVGTGTAATTIVNAASITAAAPKDTNLADNTASVPVSVPGADLGIGLAVDLPVADEGDLVTWTLTLTNQGPDAAAGVEVTDLLPAGVTYQGHVASQGSYAPGSGVWSAGAIPNGATATLALAAVVSAGTAGTTFANAAGITAGTPVDPTAANDTASVLVHVRGADLAVAVSVDEPNPGEGGLVTFTVMVANQGPDAASGVELNDLLPAGLTYQSHGASQGSYAPGSGAWTVGGLAASGSASLTLVAAVDAGTAGATIRSGAAVSASTPVDPVPANDADSTSITVLAADLHLALAIDNPRPDEGEVVTYTLTLGNLGPDDAAGIQVIDLLPAGLAWQSHSTSTGVYTPGTGVWAVGGLASGRIATLTLSATVGAGTAGTTIRDSAAVLSTSPVDANPTNDRAAVDLVVLAADLALDLAVDDATPDEGQVVAWTLTLTNAGPDPATGIRVADLLPAGLAYQSHGASQGNYVPGSGVWTVGGLASGASATLSVASTVGAGTAATTIENRAAIVAAAPADPDVADHRDSVTVAVRGADLELAMTIDVPTPDETDLVTYTLTVENRGPDAASGVEIVDLLPPGLVYQSHIASQGAYVPGTGVWTVGAIAGGASATLALAANVGAGTAGLTISNDAAITAAAPVDPDPSDNARSVNLNVGGADLVLDKAVDIAAPVEGDVVIWTLTLSNPGLNTASGIEVTDLLPAGLAYQSHVASQGAWVPGTGVWTVGGMAGGGSATLAVSAVVSAGTAGSRITNRAAITAASPLDPNLGNNADSVDVVVKAADLALALGVDDATPNEAQPIVFTLRVANQGPDSATVVEVQVLLPVGLGPPSHVASQGSFVPGTGLWTVGRIANGASATLSLTAAPIAGTAGSTLEPRAAIALSGPTDPGAANDSAAVQVTVQAADLALALAVDRPAPAEGEVVTFTLTLANQGPHPATAVAVANALPAGLTYQSHAASQGAFVAGTGAWTVGGLGSGATATLDLTATVDFGTAGTSRSDSAAIVSAVPTDPNPANDGAAVSVAVQGADLALGMAVDVATPNQGDAITFTLTLKNLGPDPATGVEVAAPIHGALAYQSHAASQGAFAPAGGAWTVGTLASGATATLDIAATVNAGTAGSAFVQRATIAATSPRDSSAMNDSAAVSVSVLGADLALGLSIDDSTPDEGQAVTWTLALANHGPDAASGVVVTDVLPAGLTYQSHGASQGAYSPVTGAWTVGGLASGAGATLTLVATVDAGTAGSTLADSAAITAATPLDPDPGDDRAGASLTVRAADLALAIAVSDPVPDEGDAVTFTLTLANLGPDAATGVEVTDALPAGLAYQFHVASRGAYDSASGVWTVGGLGSGAADTLVLGATVSAGTAGAAISNAAAISASSPVDPAGGNDAASADLLVRAVDLALVASVDRPAPHEGEVIQITLDLSNAGPDGASGVQVIDRLPAGLAYQSHAASQGGYVPGTGTWSVGTLGSGASATLTLTAQVTSGTAGTTIRNLATLTRVEQADTEDANDADTLDLAVPIVLRARVEPQAPRPLHPGGAAEELLRIVLANPSSAAVSLTRLALTDATQGPGTPAQLAAEWGRIELVGGPGARAGSLGIASGSAALTLQPLDVPVPAADSVTLIVRGGASVAARDGDRLDLRVVQATDLGFSRPVELAGGWPLDPAGSFPVDGMTAAQIAVAEVGSRDVAVGAVRELALSVRVPANGYEADLLERVNVVNQGSALPLLDLLRLELWADGDADAAFDPAADSLLGELRFTGGRWERTGLAHPIPPAGLRLFVSCDLASLAGEGRTVSLALPALPDVAFGVGSENHGPIDQAVQSPSVLTISTVDRITLTADPVTTAPVAPGAENVVMLSLTVSNSYATGHTLTALTATNTASGPGSLTELDSETLRLALRLDGDRDGVLDDLLTDPVLGSAQFVGGAARFTGLDWTLAAGAREGLFLTADVALDRARDGDVLAVQLAGASSIAFGEAVSVAADWPVQGARFEVEGMIAAQIHCNGGASATLGASEGPALALDARIPRNGYANDLLRGVSVRNAGSALPADLAEMRLWRDGGDGHFDGGAGDDADLGPMAYLGGVWNSLLLSEPLGAAGTRVFVTVTSSATPTDSATVHLVIPLDGITTESDNDGPVDVEVDDSHQLTLSTARLLAELELDPAVSTIGQTVTARMRVRNAGAEAVTGIAPTALVESGEGRLAPVSGPLPAAFDLAPGQRDSFVWTFRADSAGLVRLAGSASGTEAGGGLVSRSLTITSNTHHVYVEAQEIDLFVVESMPLAVNRGQAGVVPMSLTFTNPLGTEVSDIRVTGFRIRIEDELGNGIVPASVIARAAVSEGPNDYLVKTAIETSGSEIDLTLAQPVLIESSGGQATLGLALDVSASTTVPSFRVAIQSVGWFAAEDATSGAPVAVSLLNATAPIVTEVVRVVQEATLLEVAGGGGPPETVGLGQPNVPLLALSLVNRDPSGLGADVRVSHFDVSVMDSTGSAIADPDRFIDAIRVRSGAQVLLAHRPVTATDDTSFTVVLTSVFSIPVESPTPLTILGDIAMGAVCESFRLRLGTPSGFVARDANTGELVPVAYVASPILGGSIAIEKPADSLMAAGAGDLPDSVVVGSTGVRALTLDLVHPGSPGTGAVRCDSLRLQLRNERSELLAVDAFVDRLRVLRNGVEVGAISNPPDLGGSVVVPLAGVTIDAGGRDTLVVTWDVEAGAPGSFVEFRLNEGGLDARDVNLATPVRVCGAGDGFPFSSNLTRVVPPARELRVAFTDRMPAVLAADGTATPLATLTLHNPLLSGPSVIQVDRLTLVAGDRDRLPLPLGAAVLDLEAWIGGVLWAAQRGLAAGDSAAVLAGPTLVLEPALPVEVELRAVLRPEGAVSSFRLGCRDDGVHVIQPQSALLSVAVLAATGQSFPFWTEAGTIGGTTLAGSYSNYPNPFAAGRQQTRFVFYMPESGRVTLRVWTARGEPVATLVEDRVPAGLYDGAAWDGRNGAGEVVVNGAYLAELKVEFDAGGGERLLRKVAVVR